MPSPVCVLGMHRSGTSAIIGSLEQAGLTVGPVSQFNRFNIKGNREHPDIVSLHERVLHDNGGSWTAPPSRVIWAAGHHAERHRIVAGFPAGARWGFKDPRMLFTIDGWQAGGERLQMVGVVRHPLAVARSLAERNGLAPAQGLALWSLYNERLLTLHAREPFPLLSFDDTPDRLRDCLERVTRYLGLPGWGPASPFLDPALRHHRAEATPLPGAIEQLHAALLARTTMAWTSDRVS